jgi:hypothetical protein
MCALRVGQCPFSEPTDAPYLWSNGVIEVPVSEKRILHGLSGGNRWARLGYPESPHFRFRPWWGKLLLKTFSGSPEVAVFLMHSWSLLCWDEQGHAMYQDDRRVEGYRKLLARVAKDYDIITTGDLLGLIAEGKIRMSQTIDLDRAELR